MRDRIYRFQITGEGDPFETTDTCRAWDLAFERSVFVGRTRVSAGDHFAKLSQELSTIVGDDIEVFSEGDYLYVVSTEEQVLAPTIEKLKSRGFAVTAGNIQAASVPETEPIASLPPVSTESADETEREHAIDPPWRVPTPPDKARQRADLKKLSFGVFSFVASAAAVIVIGLWLRPSTPRSPAPTRADDGVRHIDRPSQPPHETNPKPAPSVKPSDPTRSHGEVARINQPSRWPRDTINPKSAPNEKSRAPTKSNGGTPSSPDHLNSLTKSPNGDAVTTATTLSNTLVDASRAAKTSQPHQQVTAQIVSPPEFQNWFMVGQIGKVSNSGSTNKRSELRFSFQQLTDASGCVKIPVRADIKSFTNSKGIHDTDEEGQIVERKNTAAKSALIGAGAGALIGGLAGGAKGAGVGAGAGAAAGLLFSTFGVKGPTVSFDAGSQFEVSVSKEQR